MNMNIGDIFCDIFDLGILHTAIESAICHEVQKISCDIHAQPGMMIVHGTFIAASGTPFTAPQSFYLLDSRLICLYGPRNGARLAPYIRLDLNFNWYFRKDTTLTHGINFSIYNALARNNELSYRFYYREDGSFAYAPFSFALRLMPGIGWFCKF